MIVLPRPLIALMASAVSATLLGVWSAERYASLVAATAVFAACYAAAWASRATPAQAAVVGSLAGLILAPLPVAIAAGLAIWRMTRPRGAANDNAARRWDADFRFPTSRSPAEAGVRVRDLP